MSRKRRVHARSAYAGGALSTASDDLRSTADATPREPPRIAAIDVLRGIAILAMIGYHFAFDLRYFGFTHADFEHGPYWIAVRSLILSSFLLLAGVSLVLADSRGASPRRFWMHVGRIAACALVVSAASYFMFPQTFIWFGVLHAIAVSLVLAQPLVRRPAVALILGTVVIVAGLAVADAAFDNRALGWVGFMTHKPPTEDYVPLFPWTGVLLLGIPVGHAFVQGRLGKLDRLERAPHALAWLGRHSLLIYMVHQPVLIGALWLITHR